jgi:hypothetical protein
MNSKDPITARPDGVDVVGVAEGDNGGLAARRRVVILARNDARLMMTTVRMARRAAIRSRLKAIKREVRDLCQQLEDISNDADAYRKVRMREIRLRFPMPGGEEVEAKTVPPKIVAGVTMKQEFGKGGDAE